jgi:hypothetical protein
MSDYLEYVLSAMRRAAATDCPWMLTPTQAGALVAEMERLREEVERLQQDAVIARSVETSLTVEVEQLRAERARTSHMRSSLGTALMLEREKERAAVVTYLLLPGTSCDNYALAEAIEGGDHITEGTP